MDNTQAATLGLELKPEVFPIEIVFHEEDRVLNTPVIYMPYIPKKEDKKLPDWIKDESFGLFDKFMNQKTETLDVSYNDGDSEENFVEKETGELKCLRRGKVMVRVYGPEDKSYCNVTTKLQMKVMEKIHYQKNWTSAQLNICYQQGDRLVKQFYPFAGNTGDYKLKGDGSTSTTTIISSRPDCEEWTSSGGSIEGDATFENPCKNLKRKTHEKFRETLTFGGDISKRIKYWYVEPQKISVIHESIFLDQYGIPLSDDEKPSNKRGGSISDYFIAKMRCWGSIIVEYDVNYTLFAILYDLEKPKRQYRIKPGETVYVGYVTRNKNGGVASQGNKLDGCDLEIDRSVEAYSTDLKRDITLNLALIVQVEFLPYTPRSITFFVTDKINIATASFTPEIDFNDEILKKLPKMAVWEVRVREGYIDHIEEVTFVDVMGNVTKENLEIRK
jgi:hypothetical protein